MIFTFDRTVSLSHTIYEPPNKNSSDVPFLITHGLLGSKQNWNSIAKVVARDTNRKVYNNTVAFFMSF